MNTGNSRKNIFVISAIVLVLAIVAILLFTNDTFIATPETETYDKFLKDVKDEKIAYIVMMDSYNARVLLKEGAEGHDENFTEDKFLKKDKYSDYYVVVKYRIDSTDDMLAIYGGDVMKLPKISLNDPNSGSLLSKILPYLSFALIGVMAIFLIMSMRGGKGGNSAMNFGKTKARVATNVKVKFTDVAGAEEEKEELQEIVDFLKSPKRFLTLGARIPKGVLLVGPPGTGKTLFAKAVAGEANVPFFSISGSDFVEMFVGVGASRVRDLFAQAKKNMPCIVFIDEIDAVGRQRGAGLGGGNDEREQTLNQLLVEMDGFGTNDGIIIMAATNRADILDPALMRPGRFDRQIYVHIPDVRGREAIFKVHSRNKPLASNVDFKDLARLTSGFSGADIANLLNEAAILAARNNRKEIIMKDLLEGINKVIAGPQKKSRVVTESDKRITAFHEAGHAIVGMVMKYCDNVQEVSIIPRGQAAGYTLSIPKNDDSHITKNRLNDEIAMMLGGRAAEEIVIQDVSTGASSDIKRATGIARSMVCEWGMSEELPNIFYGGDQEVFIGRDYQTQQTYGESIGAVIDKEIKSIIETNYKRAYDVIVTHREVLDKMVRLLFERETIYSDEVEMLMDGASLDEINAYIEEKLAKQRESNRVINPTVEAVIVPEQDKTATENQAQDGESKDETDGEKQVGESNGSTDIVNGADGENDKKDDEE